MKAFEAGAPRWWLVVPAGKGKRRGRWCYAPDE